MSLHFLKTSGSENAVTIRHVPEKKATQLHHHSIFQKSMIVHIIGGRTAAGNSFALYRQRQIRKLSLMAIQNFLQDMKICPYYHCLCDGAHVMTIHKRITV